MNNPAPSLAPAPRHPETRPLLAPADLLRFESELTAAFARFFHFKAHSIYFPREEAGLTEPRRLDSDGKVLIPLRFRGRVLGVFAARGARLGRGIFDRLAAIADLCVENLSLHKANLTDNLTGLYTRDYLLDSAAQTIMQQRASFWDKSGRGKAAAHSETAGKQDQAVSFGVITIRLRGLQRVCGEYGYLFMEKLLIRLAAELQDSVPEQSLPARISDGEFCVYLPQASPRQCRKLGDELAQRLAGVSLAHELSGRAAAARAAAGYACYPLHADPQSARAEEPEYPTAHKQAREILRKSRQAAFVSAQGLSEPGPAPVLAFDQILSLGGRVKSDLPGNRFKLSLGREVGARPGQCFAVWGADPLRAGFNALDADSTLLERARYRGEMVIVSAAEQESSGELFQQADPLRPVRAGDYLTLLPEGAFLDNESPGNGRVRAASPDTGLAVYGLRDFLSRFRAAGENCRSCALALLRLDILNWPKADGEPLHLGELLARAAGICARGLPPEILPDTLAGALGMHSFLFFHPHLGPEQALALYPPLAEAIRNELGLGCACGVAAYPYLNYSRADLPDMAKKALVYASLLPEPCVGLFNSLALNINADRLFSQGDAFAAIQEYKQALLADEHNTMAWTSLGVCLAGLQRQTEAKACFARALALAPQDVMVLYNLGQIHQDLGEGKTAAAFYRRCLKHDPGHVYAALRLGGLAEQAGAPARARRWYGKALALPGGQGPAQRRLAKLALNQGNLDEAREHLHQALLADPYDAASLALMARLYLDAGEDPEVALALARQSVSLRPESRAAWAELARACERAGYPEQARQAEQKAHGA